MSEMKEVTVGEESIEETHNILEELTIGYASTILSNTPSKELTPERLQVIATQASTLAKFVTQELIALQDMEVIFRAPVQKIKASYN